MGQSFLPFAGLWRNLQNLLSCLCLLLWLQGWFFSTSIGPGLAVHMPAVVQGNQLLSGLLSHIGNILTGSSGASSLWLGFHLSLLRALDMFQAFSRVGSRVQHVSGTPSG